MITSANEYNLYILNSTILTIIFSLTQAYTTIIPFSAYEMNLIGIYFFLISYFISLVKLDRIAVIYLSRQSLEFDL